MLALLVRVDNFQDNTSQSLVFGKSPVRIGRNALNDLPLKFPFVSQWHAVVAFDQNAAAYYDLGSTNGTTVGGQRLAANQPVGIPGPEYEFRIGALRLTFQRANVPESAITHGAGASAETSVAAGLLRNRSSRAPEAGHPSLEGDISSTMMIDTASIMSAAQGGAPAPSARPGLMGAARNQILGLRNHYLAQRHAAQELQQALLAVLSQMPASQVPAAMVLFAESYPEAAADPQFKALAQQQNVALPADAAGGAATQLVQQLAQYLVPNRPVPQSPQEMEGFLVRALAAMEVFATAYVSLRRSQDEFGVEMVGSSRRSADPSPVEDPQDPKMLLAYLLDWTGDGDARMQQLRSQYAEIMTHQVALLGAVMEGVRKLLQVRLSPAGILRHVEGEGGFSLGPFKAANAWKRYLALHDELTEDKEITSAIFGRDFARAYSSALGENFADNDPRRVPSGRGH